MEIEASVGFGKAAVVDKLVGQSFSEKQHLDNDLKEVEREKSGYQEGRTV